MGTEKPEIAAPAFRKPLRNKGLLLNMEPSYIRLLQAVKNQSDAFLKTDGTAVYFHVAGAVVIATPRPDGGLAFDSNPPLSDEAIMESLGLSEISLLPEFLQKVEGGGQ